MRDIMDELALFQSDLNRTNTPIESREQLELVFMAGASAMLATLSQSLDLSHVDRTDLFAKAMVQLIRHTVKYMKEKPCTPPTPIQTH